MSAESCILCELLGDSSCASFLDRSYLKLPFAYVGGCSNLIAPEMSLEIASLLNSEADLFIGKLGEQYTGDPPTTLASAEGLLTAGYTLGFRHVERNDQRYLDLCRRFERALNAPVDIHLYCTPAAQPGFGWHYDAEEVFVLQISGSKHWYLRRNTVHPWPLIDAIPSNQKYEREEMPVQHCLLAKGDWLYIPNGYWHKTVAATASMSLSVGVRPATATDFFDSLRERLTQNIFWRQRIAPLNPHTSGDFDSQWPQYQDLLATFADQIAEEMRRPSTIKDFLKQFRVRHSENHISK